MTDKEKAICKQYSKRDKNGKVHCSDCPLVIDKNACVCKKCNSTKQKGGNMKFTKEQKQDLKILFTIISILAIWVIAIFVFVP